MDNSPKPVVELINKVDGNIFAIVGVCSRALKRAGLPEQAKKMQDEIFACKSYDQALHIIMKYVEVT